MMTSKDAKNHIEKAILIDKGGFRFYHAHLEMGRLKRKRLSLYKSYQEPISGPGNRQRYEFYFFGTLESRKGASRDPLRAVAGTGWDSLLGIGGASTGIGEAYGATLEAKGIDDAYGQGLRYANSKSEEDYCNLAIMGGVTIGAYFAVCYWETLMQNIVLFHMRTYGNGSSEWNRFRILCNNESAQQREEIFLSTHHRYSINVQTEKMQPL